MPGPWIDISYPIKHGVPQWPGDPPLRMTSLCDIESGASSRVTKLEWVSHFMTHVDAPSHFIRDGKAIDELDLNFWSGEAVVVEVAGDAILEEHVPEVCDGLCVLFKTRNGDLWNSNEFQPGYVYVSGPAGELLATRKTKLVGVDYLSVDQFDNPAFPAHYAILGAGITILEGIDLRSIEPGRYELVAFPLKIVGCDGSPVRAALRKI